MYEDRFTINLGFCRMPFARAVVELEMGEGRVALFDRGIQAFFGGDH